MFGVVADGGLCCLVGYIALEVFFSFFSISRNHSWCLVLWGEALVVEVLYSVLDFRWDVARLGNSSAGLVVWVMESVYLRFCWRSIVNVRLLDHYISLHDRC